MPPTRLKRSNIKENNLEENSDNNSDQDPLGLTQKNSQAIKPLRGKNKVNGKEAKVNRKKTSVTDLSTRANSIKNAFNNLPTTHQLVKTVNGFDKDTSNFKDEILKVASLKRSKKEATVFDEDLKYILRGVVAFVDVRTSNAQTNNAVKTKLQQLGAEISSRFTSRVTHLIFKEGSKVNYEKAERNHVQIVTVLWVESCANERVRVSEADFGVTETPSVSDPKRRRSMGHKESPCGYGKNAADNPLRVESVEEPLALNSTARLAVPHSSTCENSSYPAAERVCAARHIVGTSLDGSARDILIQTAQHLEDSVYEEKFSERTTHVVCGAPRRTINVLYAIANGCWLISTEWVLQSLSAGGWLDEENYELVEKFPGAKVARLERKLFYEEHGSRGKYVPTIFKGYVIYVDSNTSPPKQILSTLIHAGGGETTEIPSDANLFVANHSFDNNKPTVTVYWILDSVEAHIALEMDDEYLASQKYNTCGSPEI